MFKNVDYSDRNKTSGKRPMQRQESEFWKMSNDKNHNFRTLFYAMTRIRILENVRYNDRIRILKIMAGSGI